MTPDADIDSASWWDGLRGHRIVLQRCTSCGRPRFPPMPRCPVCASLAMEEFASDGRGAIYSYVTAHQPVSPGYDGPFPYSVATVELADGVRVLAQVEPAGAAGIGVAVAPFFVDHAEWTELRYRVVG
jgi:uncharacterized protein